MSKTILVILVVIVVGAIAAFAGYRIGDGAGFERANQVRQQFSQQRQTGQQGGAAGLGNAGGAGGARAFTVQGTVKSVDGDTLTVTLGNRDVEVKLSDKTQVLKTAPGARADLAAGARVTITPEGNSSGAGSGGDAFNAASVTILPPQ